MEKNNRQQYIMSLAEGVAGLYWHPQQGLVLDNIFEQNDILVCYGDFGQAFDGLLEHRDGGFYVYCNENKTNDLDSPRLRFTLGHELGHYYIDEHRNALINGDVPPHPSWVHFESDNGAEREADLFASYLLMPRNKFKKKARKVETGLEGVKELAREFNTSITCTALRYLDDVLTEGLVLFWRNQRLLWKRASYEWWSSGYHRGLVNIADLVSGSPTQIVLSGSHAGEVIRKATTKAAWYKYVCHTHLDNSLLTEECIDLGKYGALTLIYPDHTV